MSACSIQETRLSVVCERVLDRCLAPSTAGGEGCDNMTMILVQFKKPIQPPSSSSSTEDHSPESTSAPKSTSAQESTSAPESTSTNIDTNPQETESKPPQQQSDWWISQNRLYYFQLNRKFLKTSKLGYKKIWLCTCIQSRTRERKGEEKEGFRCVSVLKMLSTKSDYVQISNRYSTQNCCNL